MGIYPCDGGQPFADGSIPRSYFANVLGSTRFRVSEELRLHGLTRKLETSSWRLGVMHSGVIEVLTIWFLPEVLDVEPVTSVSGKEYRTREVTHICWGSSRSYSFFSFKEAYSPFSERKSGMPHETP